MNENDLIKKLKNSDRDTWEEFVKKNWKKVYNIAYFNWCHNEYEAKDLTQIAFTEFWKNIDRFNDEYKKPLNYLIGILRKKAIDRLRKIRRQKLPVSIDASVKIDDTSEEEVEFQLADPKNIEDEIISEDLKERVRKIIIQMDDLDGFILLLRLFKPEMPDSEISQIVDMSVENVRVQRHRCLKKLKTLFQDKGIVL